jgi:hypothetical protein
MQVERYIAKGQIVSLLFAQDAVAASQTDAQLSIMETAATGIHLVDGYTMPWDGEVVAITADVDSAATAGSLTAGATIGGTEDADTTITLTTAAAGRLVVPRGKATFVAGDIIGAEITTDGSWNGTASDLAVQVWVLLHVEGI